MKLLKPGDIVELKRGHEVYVELPAHFCYSNREGTFDELARTEVTIGKPKGGMDTEWLAGRYVVTSVAEDGGGTGMGDRDVYPSGHHVHCEKLQRSRHDSRVKVDFYQTGCFTAMIKEIEPVGRAVARWEEGEVK